MMKFPCVEIRCFGLPLPSFSGFARLYNYIAEVAPRNGGYQMSNYDVVSNLGMSKLPEPCASFRFKK